MQHTRASAVDTESTPRQFGGYPPDMPNQVDAAVIERGG